MKYDYLEIFVGTAKTVAYWHVKGMGFEVVAYCGPETGNVEQVSYLLAKNDIRLLITSAYQHENQFFVNTHGNSVKRFAISVENVGEAYQNALQRGAIPLLAPYCLVDEKGEVEQAHLKLFDDNEIVFINRTQYKGTFKPKFQAFDKKWFRPNFDSHLQEIDHLTCALRENEMAFWEGYWQNIFQATTIQSFEKQEVSAANTGLYMKVLQSQQGKFNQVLVEPVNEVRKSQVQVFLDAHKGTGVQHIAFSSNNILETKEALAENGVEFTTYPNSYYENLRKKYPHLDIDLFQQHQILCDVMDDAILLQTFTQPIDDRPTLFYEIVQRINNYNGFGLENVKALFEAVAADLEKKSLIMNDL
ncbi:MAG: 4-hydroxyphenylpyruvate dioxygenase [Bacteroidia bacterium]